MDVKVVEQVQHRFTVTEDDGTQFTDALYFDVGAVPDAATLESLRTARFNAWKAVVAAPPVAPTPQQVQDGLAASIQEKARIDTQLATVPLALLTAAYAQAGVPMPIQEIPIEEVLEGMTSG